MGRQTYALSTKESDLWEKVLRLCDSYDVYHLPGYHELAEEQKDSRAVLFVYEFDSTIISIPMLLREIKGIPGIETSGYFDAVSVYGYPGPVSNNPDPSKEVKRDFARVLRNYWEDNKVVSAFSRLHPLLDQELLLEDTGKVTGVGPTAAIDLTLPIDIQRQNYRTDHKYRINKAKREGVVCKRDKEWQHFDSFIDIYNKTMQRVDADDYYFFDYDYFYRLRDLLEGRLHLFVALLDDVVISGSLFTVCNSIIQYHLSGTYAEYLDLSPNRVILDTARIWGTRSGARILHLGGGVGGKEDGLFHFKAGFSNQTHQFNTWRAVVNQEVYQALTEQKQGWNEQHGLEVADEDYFPAYRAPTRESD